MKLFILCLAAFIAGGECFAINNPKASACEFLVNSLPQPTPLLVNPGTATFFRASDASGTLGFNVGQSVLVACTGSTNYVSVSLSSIFKKKIKIIPKIYRLKDQEQLKLLQHVSVVPHSPLMEHLTISHRLHAIDGQLLKIEHLDHVCLVTHISKSVMQFQLDS